MFLYIRKYNTDNFLISFQISLALHISDVFHKSLKVKKLSEVLTYKASLAENVEVGNYTKIPDVDMLVSMLKVRADNSVCFVLGNYSLAKGTFFLFNLCNSSCSIELVLVDPNMFTWRTISIQKLSNQGDRLLLEKNQWLTFNLDLSRDVFVEKDPTKNCTVYPNNEYESYGECDQAFVETMFPGIVPIWNTDNMSKATRNSSITEEKKLKVQQLAEGLVASPCKLPCTSTKVTAQLSMQAAFNKPGVRVAEIYKPSYYDPV